MLEEEKPMRRNAHRFFGLSFLLVCLAVGSFAEADANTTSQATPCPGLTEGTKDLSLAISVNAGFLSATQHQQTYGGDILLFKNWNLFPKACGWSHQRTFLELTPSYDDKKGKKPPANITQNYDGRIQHLFFLKSDRYFSSLDGDFYHNNSLGIYFQQTYAAGIGALFLNNHVELGGGLAVLGEHFYPPARSVSLLGTRLSERLSIPLNLIPGKPTLSETGVFIPVFNESDAWQVRGVVTLFWALPKGLSINIKTFDDYLRNAPSAFTKNYVKTSLSIGYTFAK
jgi:hypothetical protein